MKERVLITGNLGYIGSVLSQIMLDNGYEVIGYDSGLYDGCFLTYAVGPSKQIRKDIRNCEVEDFIQIDYVFHLAGLSNDELGNYSKSLTDEINYQATMRVAECAKRARVKKFVYASSQSIYGLSDLDKEVTEDDSKNPLTEYAISKWKAEKSLQDLASDDYIVTILRPATAYGVSPNLRCDIVFNFFMGCAYTLGVIDVKSDGKPWRPMAHVKDISAAFLAVINAPEEKVQNQAFNIGTDSFNYQVYELANAVKVIMPESVIKYTFEHTNYRSYRVSAKKICNELEGFYQPTMDIFKGGRDLLKFFNKISFTEDIFKGYKCSRMKCLQKNLEEGRIDSMLYFK